MDNLIFEALHKYFTRLKQIGYHSYNDVNKILVMIFVNDITTNDYRGRLSESDYVSIDRTMACLFGSSCLIPYNEYLKMNKLKIGEITELANRLKIQQDMIDNLQKQIEELHPDVYGDDEDVSTTNDIVEDY